MWIPRGELELYLSYAMATYGNYQLALAHRCSVLLGVACGVTWDDDRSWLQLPFRHHPPITPGWKNVLKPMVLLVFCQILMGGRHFKGYLLYE